MGIKSQKALLGVETKIAHSHLNLEEKKWRNERKEDSKLSFWWFRAVDTNQYFDSFYILRKDSSSYMLRNCKYLVLSMSTGAVKSTWSLRKHYFIVKFWWKKKYSLIVKYQNILLSLCQSDTRDPNTWIPCAHGKML